MHAYLNINLSAAAPAVLTVLSACASGEASAAPTFARVAARVPREGARIFFYPGNEPYGSIGRPYITLNSNVTGISEPGGVFYRAVRRKDRICEQTGEAVNASTTLHSGSNRENQWPRLPGSP